MSRILNWVRQNLVTVIEVIEILIRALRLIVTAAARLVAFTETTKDDEFVAKVSDFIKQFEATFKGAKSFLLGNSG